MAVGAASKLDIEKFRKVHSLMAGGSTDGERAAARARAETMASKAGMTLAEAVSSLDSQPAAPQARNFFQDMEDAMEAAHPGYRAEREAEEADRQRRQADLQQEAIKEFGSEEAVWAETERERLLREALEPLADWKTFSNSGRRYIDGYAGWKVGAPPWPLMQALMKAYPFPADVVGLWKEFREWERLHEIREAFHRHHDPEPHVRARTAALQHLLDTFSDWTFEGFAARLEWLRFRIEHDLSFDVIDDLAMVATMQTDFAMLRAKHREDAAHPSESSSPSVHSGHRTTAEKRAAVLSTLDAHPELSDREIARRLGVSPQTVNTWRKKRRG